MLWVADAVHTTGINWESVTTIIVGIVTTISIIGGLFIKYLSQQIKDGIVSAIDRFRIDVINKLDLRLTTVESKLDNIRQEQTQVRVDLRKDKDNDLSCRV
jgi:predicted cation transporter